MVSGGPGSAGIMRIFSGMAYGAALGAGVGALSHLARGRHSAVIRAQILERYPDLCAHGFLVEHFAGIYEVASPQDLEFIGENLSLLARMERDDASRSSRSNKIADLCIQRYKHVCNALRFSRIVDHRLLAEDLNVDEFARCCRDVVHNILLRSSRRPAT